MYMICGKKFVKAGVRNTMSSIFKSLVSLREQE